MERLMTIDDVAAYLKMSKNKVYSMAQKKLIPASKIGNQWRFTEQSINEWIFSKTNTECIDKPASSLL